MGIPSIPLSTRASSSERQAAKKRRRRAREPGSNGRVPALLPELVAEYQDDDGLTLRPVNWPEAGPVVPGRVDGGPERLAALLAEVHCQLGTYLRVTVRHLDGRVDTEILAPASRASERRRVEGGVVWAEGFAPGEEVWLTAVLSVEAAEGDGRVNAGRPQGLSLVVAPESGRVVLVDPADDGDPALLVLRGEGTGR